MICERPRCNKECTGDLLYCSERCYDLDHEPVPVQPLARNKVGGFGDDFSRWGPEVVGPPPNWAKASPTVD